MCALFKGVEMEVKAEFFCTELGKEKHLQVLIRSKAPMSDWDHGKIGSFSGVHICVSTFDFAAGRGGYKGDIIFGHRVIAKGVNFTGKTQTSGTVWDCLRKMVTVEKEVSVTGLINSRMSERFISFYFLVEESYTLTDLLSLKIAQVGIEQACKDGSAWLPRLIYQGKFGGGLAKSPEIIMTTNTEAKFYELYGDFEGKHSLTFADVINLFDIKGFSFDSILPEGFTEKYFGTLALGYVRLEYDCLNSRLKCVELTIKATNKWIILKNIVAVQPIFYFKIDNPFDSGSRTVDFQIRGTWELGHTLFDVVAIPSCGQIGAVMRSGEILDISEVTGKLLGGLSLPKLELNAMKFLGDFKAGSYHVFLSAATGLEFDIGICKFGITEVSLACTYDGKKMQEVEASGKFSLGGIIFSVDAVYDRNGQWSFSGGGCVDLKVSFVDMFKELQGLLGISGASVDDMIPPSYLSLEISSIYLNYKAGGEFNAYLDIKHLLKISNKFEISEVIAQATFGPKGFVSGKIMARFEICGACVILSLTKNASGWLFQGGTPKGTIIPVGKLFGELATLFGARSLIFPRGSRALKSQISRCPSFRNQWTMGTAAIFYFPVAARFPSMARN